MLVPFVVACLLWEKSDILTQTASTPTWVEFCLLLVGIRGMDSLAAAKSGRFTRLRPEAFQAGVYIALFFLLFFPSLLTVFSAEWADENANYGILVLPVCVYLVWEKADALAAFSRSPTWPGFFVFLFGILVFSAGRILESDRLAALGAWPVAVGLLFIHLGWSKFRALSFPVLFSLAAIPIPDSVYARLVHLLQLLSAHLSVAFTRMMGISAFRKSDIIDIGSDVFWVSEACSGIRYLIPIVLLAVLIAYFFLDSRWKQILLVATSIPAVLFSNSLRIALTFYFHETVGPETAAGFFHEFSGWLIFMMTFGFLGVEVALLRKIRGSGFRVQGSGFRVPGSKKQQETAGQAWLLRSFDPASRRQETGEEHPRTEDQDRPRLRPASREQQTEVSGPGFATAARGNQPTGAGFQQGASIWKRVLLDPPQFLPAVMVLAVVWVLGLIGFY